MYIFLASEIKLHPSIAGALPLCHNWIGRWFLLARLVQMVCLIKWWLTVFGDKFCLPKSIPLGPSSRLRCASTLIGICCLQINGCLVPSHSWLHTLISASILNVSPEFMCSKLGPWWSSMKRWTLRGDWIVSMLPYTWWSHHWMGH